MQTKNLTSVLLCRSMQTRGRRGMRRLQSPQDESMDLLHRPFKYLPTFLLYNSLQRGQTMLIIL